MKKRESLKELVRTDGFLYTKDVVAAGIRKEQLKKLLEDGELVRESRGIYSFSDTFTDEFALLQARCKKGVFSYGTALYFHGLSDRFPQQISLTVPKIYNVHYLQKELLNVEFHKVKSDWWTIGIIDIVSPQGASIRVYNKERCICDMVRNKNKTDPQIFRQSLKDYFSSKGCDCIRLMEYARRFGIEEKVQDYMEILI